MNVLIVIIIIMIIIIRRVIYKINNKLRINYKRECIMNEKWKFERKIKDRTMYNLIEL